MVGEPDRQLNVMMEKEINAVTKIQTGCYLYTPDNHSEVVFEMVRFRKEISS